MAKNVKNKKKVSFVYKLFSCLLFIVTLCLMFSILSLNILNFWLLVLVMVFILGVSGLSIFLLLKSRIKRIGLIFSFLLIILFGVIFFYINKTNDFLDNLNLGYKTYNYSVVVRNDDIYEKINDIRDCNVGYYNDGSVHGDKALDKVFKRVEFEKVGYEDTNSLVEALFNEELDAILIEDSYLDILSESVVYEGNDFKDNIDKVYSFGVVVNTNDIVKDINVTKEAFNIYVSGIDTYGEISSVSRSDVNMIISVNPDTRQILLISIPRDYYVKLHGKSGYRDKLTHAGIYGVDMSIKTLEDLLDVEINYYVKVNFSSVIDIVDQLGGIRVFSDYEFTSIDNYSFDKGYNNVNGEEALSFARERKAFLAGDRQRVKNQQEVFMAIFDKCMSKDIITKYSKLLDSVRGSFVTNMPTARMTSLVRMQLNNNYSWNIVTNSLDGSDSSDYTYSASNYKSYVMIPNDASVLYTKELINRIEDGVFLDEEVMDEVSEEVSLEFDDEVVFRDNSSKSKKGLNAKLVRTSVTLFKGSDYIYHGYSATYDGEDITEDEYILENFSVNGKTFDDYRELVRYVTYNLDVGDYKIIYNISYKGETKVLKQDVSIKES